MKNLSWCNETDKFTPTEIFLLLCLYSTQIHVHNKYNNNLNDENHYKIHMLVTANIEINFSYSNYWEATL
jgi:hypothetical protein